MNRISKIGILAATAVLTLAAGCQDSPHEVRRDGFVPDDQPREVRHMADQQEAIGARRDATLHACHFDTAGLNSLGQQKLDMMLAADEPAEPMVVYLDVPDDQKLPNAHQMITDYLKTCGLLESQLVVKDGPNPGAAYSAADASTGLKNLQAAAAAGAAGSGSGSGSGAAASGSGSTAPPTAGTSGSH
jgi:hypothetical protein